MEEIELEPEFVILLVEVFLLVLESLVGGAQTLELLSELLQTLQFRLQLVHLFPLLVPALRHLLVLQYLSIVFVL